MTEAVQPAGRGAAGVAGKGAPPGPDHGGGLPAPASLAEAGAQLARLDELPLPERARLLAAINELLVAELAAMDEA